MVNTTLITASLALLAASQLFAQSTPVVSVELTAFFIGGAPAEKIMLATSEGSKAIKFKRRERSNVIDYSGPNPVVFFTTQGEADRPESRRIVATASIPDGVTKALVLLLPEGDSHRAIAINDSRESFPVGSLKVLNVLGSPIYAQIGEERVVLEPGASKPISLLDFVGRTREREIVTGGTNNERVETITSIDNTAPIRFAVRKDGRYEHIYDSPLQVSPRMRYLLIALPNLSDPDSSQINTVMLYEEMRGSR